MQDLNRMHFFVSQAKTAARLPHVAGWDSEESMAARAAG
jgi:hypothetical protein